MNGTSCTLKNTTRLTFISGVIIYPNKGVGKLFLKFFDTTFLQTQIIILDLKVNVSLVKIWG
jgi:hypothetical protein